jgi:hypothetical protein
MPMSIIIIQVEDLYARLTVRRVRDPVEMAEGLFANYGDIVIIIQM